MEWIDGIDFLGQNEDVKSAVMNAMAAKPVDKQSQHAGTTFMRVLWAKYSVPDMGITVKITYQYANNQTDNEWAGLQSFTIEKV